MKCLCGCGRNTPLAAKNRKERGWIKDKPLRFIPGHHYGRPGKLYKINFNGCWMWLRYKMKNGYAMITRNRKPQLAHRYFYEKKRGAIPSGFDLDHICHNEDTSCAGGWGCPHRACVNPDHGEIVSRLTNSHRGRKPKITQDIANQIRKLRGIKTQKEISVNYKIGRTLVYNIWKNTIWLGENVDA